MARARPVVWAAVLALVAVGSAGSAGSAAPAKTADRHVAVKGRHFDFEYAYPAVAAAIPGLRAWLEADLKAKRSEQQRVVAEGLAADRESGQSHPKYDFSQTWDVVAQTPRWLSLSAGIADYSGGAHYNYASETVLWDKQMNRLARPVDLFVSKAALAAAIRAPFCAELDRQRAEKRGAPVNRASGDDFDACIDPTDSVVILGSRGKRAFDRIGVLVGPYAAGPWTEADYEVTLPVTARVLAAVKPAYRDSFALMR